jgi:hypothetical protein
LAAVKQGGDGRIRTTSISGPSLLAAVDGLTDATTAIAGFLAASKAGGPFIFGSKIWLELQNSDIGPRQ